MKENELSHIVGNISDIIQQARSLAYRQVNLLAVATNFAIGRIIVENEQSGEQRAPYGKETLKQISRQLTDDFGKGYSVDNLQLMRLFYISFSEKIEVQNYVTLSRNSLYESDNQKSVTLSRIFSGEIKNPFQLSWSHYVELIKMTKPERDFYEIESIKNNWSVRELRRQFNTSLFERLALSKNKDEVRNLSKQGQLIEKPSDLVKQSYILDFLG